MDNSESHLEKGAIEKLRYALEVQRINNRMMEHLSSSLRWVLHYCDKNNLPLPNKDEISRIVDEAIEIEKQSPLNQPTFDSQFFHRRLDRTLTQ